MTAFFIATPKITDAEKFQEYAAKAGKTTAAFGGELVIRGAVANVLAGESDHTATAVVKFADIKTLNDWYQSAEYQAIIPLRDSACEMNLVAYSVPT